MKDFTIYLWGWDESNNSGERRNKSSMEDLQYICKGKMNPTI